MTPASILHQFFRPAPVRRHAEALAALLGDWARLNFAEAWFNEGDYGRARGLYAAIEQAEPPSASAIKARQMVDWIDYKRGEVSRGWPAYPGVRFAPGAPDPTAAPPAGPVRVADPNKPYELVRDLHLPEWKPGGSAERPILVWFNFRASLGGELLAAKVVRAFRTKFGPPLVLVADPRLQEVLSLNFPGTPVLTKDDDLAPLAATCGSYLLARDALKHVVAEEADLAAVAAEVFSIAPALPASPGESAPVRVALSWKTTNKRQGLYRNVPLEPLARRLAATGIEFHSAQHGLKPEERALLEKHLGGRIRFDSITPSASVATLASQLAAMDAVVTIDNSVLHIAGTFDIPTFGLLSLPSYWAWPESGPSSRWYRSVTLIHQTRPKHWDGALAELGDRLKVLEKRT